MAKVYAKSTTNMSSSEVYRALPVRNQLLQSMIHADWIGFQTFGYLTGIFSKIKWKAAAFHLIFENVPVRYPNV